MVVRTLLLGAACSLLACASLEEEVCDARCECEGCTDAALKDCLADGKDASELAEEAGCGQAYDQWLECQVDTGECDKGVFSARCGPQLDGYKECISDE